MTKNICEEVQGCNNILKCLTEESPWLVIFFLQECLEFFKITCERKEVWTLAKKNILKYIFHGFAAPGSH